MKYKIGPSVYLTRDQLNRGRGKLLVGLLQTMVKASPKKTVIQMNYMSGIKSFVLIPVTFPEVPFYEGAMNQ